MLHSPRKRPPITGQPLVFLHSENTQQNVSLTRCRIQTNIRKNAFGHCATCHGGRTVGHGTQPKRKRRQGCIMVVKIPDVFFLQHRKRKCRRRLFRLMKMQCLIRIHRPQGYSACGRCGRNGILRNQAIGRCAAYKKRNHQKPDSQEMLHMQRGGKAKAASEVRKT